jgi:O-methyltransferase
MFKSWLWKTLKNKYFSFNDILSGFNRQSFFNYAFRALQFNQIDGDYAEFGCWGCKTFYWAYVESRRHETQRHYWAFDSFQGLPSTTEPKDDHPLWREGAMCTTLEDFHKLCAKKRIARDHYDVIPGFYHESLGNKAPADEPTNIALAYIDCDMYSSTKSVLEFLLPRLKHGMIIAFDDYFCYSGVQISGERKAMLEIFENHERWWLEPFLRFTWQSNSFIVEDKRILQRG